MHPPVSHIVIVHELQPLRLSLIGFNAVMRRAYFENLFCEVKDVPDCIEWRIDRRTKERHYNVGEVWVFNIGKGVE